MEWKPIANLPSIRHDEEALYKIFEIWRDFVNCGFREVILKSGDAAIHGNVIFLKEWRSTRDPTMREGGGAGGGGREGANERGVKKGWTEKVSERGWEEEEEGGGGEKTEYGESTWSRARSPSSRGQLIWYMCCLLHL